MAKQSPLKEFHQARGAAWTERDGWLLPLHFGSPAREYVAVRSAVGLVDLCHVALLRLTGSDRLSFLQGMVSNELKGLNDGEGLYACLLNVQGKVVADVMTLCADDAYLVALWEPLKDKAVAHVNRYLVADDVEILDQADEVGCISVQGPRAPALLQELLRGVKLPDKELSHVKVDFAENEGRLVRYSHTGEAGFVLFIDHHTIVPVAERATDAGAAFSASWIGEQTAEALRIESGIPRYGIDFDEEHLLLETGLDHAVSFSKGCYLGQEVVERIHSRGHVNKKLAGLIIDGDSVPKAGDTISAKNTSIGVITSGVFSPTLCKPIGLGYVRKDYWTPATVVAVTTNGAQLNAVVAALPFVKGSATCLA